MFICEAIDVLKGWIFSIKSITMYYVDFETQILYEFRVMLEFSRIKYHYIDNNV